jgi:hypothetical protein
MTLILIGLLAPISRGAMIEIPYEQPMSSHTNRNAAAKE